jgi:hypothetical protein
MTLSTRFASVIVAACIAFTAIPTAVAAAAPAPTAARLNTNAVGTLACSHTPLPGHVTFYQHTNCGGAFQDMSRCGTHPFTGALFRQASSYWDEQTDGAYAIVYEGQSTRAFTTIPQTDVRNVAVWENDRSEWANVVCP